jgi:hypothetical protein
MKDPRDPHSRRRWQFGIGSLLLFTTLFSLLMGAFAGMIRTSPGEPLAHGRLYLILAAAAPLGMLVVVGGSRALVRWFKKWKNGDI